MEDAELAQTAGGGDELRISMSMLKCLIALFLLFNNVILFPNEQTPKTIL